ncbi:hypothetical protein [Pseudomonas sp. OV226]|jgi:hypothetical protein|uniref:hypothetical protein n=1 Tax=Pseudomonas sp. OV226 TaxID=2135588 RepID=UPI000D6AB024|nr:hypothetical protein [Pseudomonas sp. OV226]PWK42948.1 hypothetical protein C7534_104119 [Pseudomonas sp. OV226]
MDIESRIGTNFLKADFPLTLENLAIKTGDTVENSLNPRSSVRFKLWNDKAGVYSLSTIALGGPDEDRGSLWKAPEKGHESYKCMLSLSNGDVIHHKGEYFEFLCNRFEYPQDGTLKLKYLGAAVKQI